MSRLTDTRWKRATAAVLFLVFVLLSAVADVIVYYGRYDRWYQSGSRVGFENTEGCIDYVNSANYYVEQNIRWIEDMSLESLGSYAGPAYSYVIRNGYGRITADTRTENSVFVNDNGFVPVPEPGFTVEGYVNLPVEPYGGCYAEYAMFTLFFGYRYWMLALKLITLLLAGLMAASLCTGAFRRGRAARLRGALLWPADVVLIVCGILFFLAGALGYDASDRFLQVFSTFTGAWPGMVSVALSHSFSYALRVVLFAAFVWFVMGQLGAHCLRKNLLVRRMVYHIPPWAVILGIMGAHVLLLLAAAEVRSMEEVFYLLLLLFDAVVIVALFRCVGQTRSIKDAARELASGHLSHKTDTKKLHFIWRTLGEDLNRIGDGMSAAVEDRMRSERMKTELITNVSHDLKTPLTSIINYIDFLKRDDLTEEKRREYLEILDRQGARLKKLTEDVVEASKAASGVLTASCEPIDAVELLQQLTGEYEDRFIRAQITPVLKLPQTPCRLMADSTLLARVLDNLFSNIVKYAQPDTRAYFDLWEEGDTVRIDVKNTSREPLNISAEELMERFVRGDSSRHTEGSGLGLSIARSLTELMGGRMQLVLDGDLFKAELFFPGAPLPASEVHSETRSAIEA